MPDAFPAFPTLWSLLAMGVALGGAVTVVARRNQREREVPVREILGIPGSIPVYTLLAVVAAGLLTLVFPPAALLLVPGLLVDYAFSMDGDYDELSGRVAFARDLVLTIGVSWLCWTICAAAVWRAARPAKKD